MDISELVEPIYDADGDMTRGGTQVIVTLDDGRKVNVMYIGASNPEHIDADKFPYAFTSQVYNDPPLKHDFDLMCNEEDVKKMEPVFKVTFEMHEQYDDFARELYVELFGYPSDTDDPFMIDLRLDKIIYAMDNVVTTNIAEYKQDMWIHTIANNQ